MNCEKCDMGVFKLVTTQIAEKKADKIVFLCIDTETGRTDSFLPGQLEVADARVVKAVYEDFARGLEIGDLERA